MVSAVENVTASMITVEEVTGSHLFIIEKYSTIQKLHAKGESLESATFDVGGYGWYLRYYPNGDKNTKAGHTSIYLHLVRGNVTAYFTVTVVDKNGKELCKSRSSEIIKFSFWLYNWGFPSFVRKSVLESGDLKDDCVIIKCTVTVVKKPRLEICRDLRRLGDALGNIWSNIKFS
ncbi:hypothetical protein LUZ61_010530 [Rhynchospora tenuis]|uniref:MATH domain-containing protein n=1 Tax=Rhynchospora tenuis TaxID=198213 RepID=A0AAD6EZL1_9POAL|nr:hypothetical protein LUZ61_010530 [Rhynchospora tenuis]